MMKYILHPYFIVNRRMPYPDYLVVFFKAIIMSFFLIGASGILLTFIDPIISKAFNIPSILGSLRKSNEKLATLYQRNYFMVIVILGPILEELIFRLHLSLTKTSISVSISLLSYVLMGGSIITLNLTDTQFYIRIILTAFIFLLLNRFILRESITDALKKKYFSIYFFLSAIMFALFHITNLSEIKYLYLPIYLMYVLPQFLMALSLGYVRMRIGLVGAIVLHMVFNSFYFFQNN